MKLRLKKPLITISFSIEAEVEVLHAERGAGSRVTSPPPLDWVLSPLPSAAESSMLAASRLAARLRATLPESDPVFELQPRKILYASGQQENGFLYLIERGLVKAQNFSISGKSSLFSIYGADELIGDSCLVRQVRPETVTALTPTLFRRISRAKMSELTAADLEFAKDWLRYKISRDLERQETITLFIVHNSEQRLGWLLLALAHKFGSHRADGISVDNLLTHEDLAQMIGTTRSRVGSFLKNFRLFGLIRVAGNSIIINHLRLHAYLCASGTVCASGTSAQQGWG